MYQLETFVRRVHWRQNNLMMITNCRRNSQYHANSDIRYVLRIQKAGESIDERIIYKNQQNFIKLGQKIEHLQDQKEQKLKLYQLQNGHTEFSVQFQQLINVFISIANQGSKKVENTQRHQEPIIISGREPLEMIIQTQVESGSEVLHMDGMLDYVYCSSDGQLIVCAIGEQILIFNTSLTILYGKLIGHTNHINTIDMFQNCLIASGGQDSSIRLWNARKFNQVAILQGHVHGVRRVEFFSSIKLISAGYDNNILIWCIPQQSRIYNFTIWASDFQQLPNQQLLLYDHKNNGLRVWDQRINKNTLFILGDRTVVTLNCKVISTGLSQRRIAYCDLTSGKIIRSLRYKHTRNQIAIDADEVILVSNKIISIWNLMTGIHKEYGKRQEHSIWSVTLSCDRNYVLYGGYDKKLTRISIESLCGQA